ncbi:hypothetical protein GCM10009118_24080 [Wandonia haliotis]|uniref:Uncharacterized protein n=1 Tax=Wandonia haliotis TaxID=574963 RepID=A0ABP3Y368_9FLAO
MINRFEKFWCEIFLVIRSAQDEDDVKFGQIFSVLVVGLCILGNLLTLSYIIDLCFGLTIPKNWIKVIFYFAIFTTIILLIFIYLKYIRNSRYVELATKKNFVKNRKPFLIYVLSSMSLILLVIYFMQK